MPDVHYFQEEKDKFIRRLAFDEILLNQIKIEHIRKIRSKVNGISLNSDSNLFDKTFNPLDGNSQRFKAKRGGMNRPLFFQIRTNSLLTATLSNAVLSTETRFRWHNVSTRAAFIE